jgi:hypothetical protein
VSEAHPELYDYDGLLFIETDAPEKMRRISEFIASYEFKPVALNGNTVEIKYSGRDANRWFVSWLKKLADLAQEATGEIVCTITTDEGDPFFEFFQITKGQLLRQHGRIIRNGHESVD